MTIKLFDYRCNRCEHEFEKFTNTANAEIIKCSKCGSEKVQKMLNFAGYHIWGTNTASVRPKRAGSFKKPKKE
jgi:putative FmdB family regulatory protein